MKNILGNANSIRHIKEGAKNGTLPHGFIISGEKGSGKKTFAEYISAALLCDEGPEKGPCGKCPSCIKAASGNHPDIIHVEHQKESLLSTDEVRDQLIAGIDVPPFYGPYKIYIVKDAHLLNDNGQNAILKTIEEPPSYALIFLLADNADVFLETVRSRCIRLDMEMLDVRTIEKELEANGISKDNIKEYAAFSGGNLGLALSLEKEGGIADIKDDIVRRLKDIKNQDALEIYKLGDKLDRSTGKETLNIMLMWYRDILVAKACDNKELYFVNDRAVVKNQAKMLSYEAINNAIGAIEEASARLKAGVDVKAVFETLMFNIREEYR